MEIPKGFNLEDTGGGCTAWVSDDRRFYIVQGDPVAPESMTEPCSVGLYDENGEYLYSNEFSSVETALDYIRVKQSDLNKGLFR